MHGIDALGRMKTSQLLGFERDEGELVATFGDARLVKKFDKKLEIIGGSEDDRLAALEWCSMFLRQSRLLARPDCKIPTPRPY
jgi:hypothetical protein